MLENVVDYDSDNEGQDNNGSDFDFLNPDLLDVAIENNGNNIDFTPATSRIENMWDDLMQYKLDVVCRLWITGYSVIPEVDEV